MSAILATLHVVYEIEARIIAYDWPWPRENAAAIDAHWAKEKAAQPSLFNGRLYMAKSHAFAGGGRKLEMEVFETDYAAYLAWRAMGWPDSGVNNFFSMACIQGSDGAFLLAEMGADTANSGRIYFPSGTPDRSDVVGENLDLGVSAIRELGEETGLGPDDVTVAPEWVVILDGPRIACMKPMRLKLTAEAAKAKVDAFLASEPAPELGAMHVARNEADLARLKPAGFAATYMRYVWA